MHLAAASRISLIEDEVDHGRHRGEAFGALHRARSLVGHARLRDPALGAGDALLHRGLGHEECARDLLDREAANHAQRQRDLLRRRQVGMAADEQEPQDVVAVMGLVDALDQRGLGVVHVRDDLLVRERDLSRLAPQGVDGEVAPDQDEPGGGIARRAVGRPGLERPQAGVLHGLLRRVEVAEVAHQGRQRTGPCGGDRATDPIEVDIGHVPPRPGQNMETGLIS